MTRRWLGPLLSLFSVVVLLGGFIAVEAYLTSAGWEIEPYPDDQFHRQRWSNGPCYEMSASRGGALLRSTDFSGRERHVLPLARTGGVPRVAVVGASTAESFEWGTLAVAEDSTCSVEILRCSVPGGDARQVLRRLEEVMGYRPDAVVLAFGHNAFRSNPTGDFGLLLTYYRTRSRLLTALSSSGPPRRQSPAAVTGELIQNAAQRAQRAGLPLITTTMVSNLRMPPVPGWDESNLALEPRIAHALGRFEAARAGFEAMERTGMNARGHFLYGEFLLARGRLEKARRQLRLARDRDAVQSRASSATNDRIRRVAQDLGLDLIDVERAASLLAPGGIPGWGIIEDHVHPRDAVRRLVGREILRRLALPAACRASLESQPGDARASLEDYLRSFDLLANQAEGGWTSHWGRGVGKVAQVAVDQFGIAAASPIYERFISFDAPKRASIAAPLALGLWLAGATEQAMAVLNQLRTPAPAADEIDRALVLLASGQGRSAMDALGRAGVRDPEHLLAAFDP